MPNNELPMRVTKAKVKQLYFNWPEKEVASYIRDIQKQLRKKRYSPNSHNLSFREWLCFLKDYGVPPGYSRVFSDFELLEDKLKNYPELNDVI